MSKPDMTQARVMKIQKGTVITLPSDFVDAIGQPYALVILVMKDKNVKLYPVDSGNVMYLKLEIEKLSKSFLEELTMVFEKAGLEDILFTSGICQAASQCYYECYFTPEQLKISPSDLELHMKQISGVQKVILKKVPLTG
ncbi:MAG: hypothetical protein HXY34_05065 [Candidatus Thorarchaeota archaeon]|nr:hypothetical protein [Candidatus Thorarchaeota archaeon]